MFVSNWRAVLKHAWSLRLIALSVLLGAAELGLPYLDGELPLSQRQFAALVLLNSIAAGVARFIQQKDVSSCPPR
jgi:hypothetical protein